MQYQQSDDEFIRLLLQLGLFVMAVVLVLHQFGVDASVDDDAEDAIVGVDQFGALQQELLGTEGVRLDLSGGSLLHFE